MDSKVRDDTALLAGRRSPKRRRVGVDSTSTGAAPSSSADHSAFSRLSSDVLLAMANFADFRDVARLARCSRYLRTTLTLDLNASPPSRVVSALRCCEMNLDGWMQPESLVVRLLAAATRLETLALHTSSLPENALPVSLHTLVLHGPSLPQSLRLIAHCSNIRSLSLGSTSGILFAALPPIALPALRQLTVKFSHFTHAAHFIALVKAAPNLESIHVDQIRTDGSAFIQALTRLKNLQRLWLDEFLGDLYCFWIGLLPRIESLRELTFGRNFPRAINATHMPDQITHLRCLSSISEFHSGFLRNLQQLYLECPEARLACFQLNQLGDCLPALHTLTIEFTSELESMGTVVDALHNLRTVAVPKRAEWFKNSKQYHAYMDSYTSADGMQVLPALARAVIKACVKESGNDQAKLDDAVLRLKDARPTCAVALNLRTVY